MAAPDVLSAGAPPVGELLIVGRRTKPAELADPRVLPPPRMMLAEEGLICSA